MATWTVEELDERKRIPCVCICDKLDVSSCEGASAAHLDTDFYCGENYLATPAGWGGYEVNTRGGRTMCFTAQDFARYFLIGTSADYDTAQRLRHKHELAAVTQTKGGYKIKVGLAYAVYVNGTPAGINGEVWRYRSYRECRWTDEGVCVSFSGAEYDLPFAPERETEPDEEPAEIPQQQGIQGDATGKELVGFEVALLALKRGKHIARADWGGFWYTTTGYKHRLLTGEHDPLSLPFLVMAALKDGTFEVAQPRQSDWMAEDWVILD